MYIFLLACFIYVLYFLPLLIAIARNHRNVKAIALFNFIFGWTGLGWLFALIWAFTYQDKRI